LQFQNFLNSLDFPVQFFIQSRRLDIRPYTQTLEERYSVQRDDLMKLQIREYISFVKEFTSNTDIMTKNFFIVVGYQPPIINTDKGLLGQIFKKRSAAGKTTEDDLFYENNSQLEQRVAVVSQGLIRSGVRVIKLGTGELVELFFKIFNPGEQGRAARITKETYGNS